MLDAVFSFFRKRKARQKRKSLRGFHIVEFIEGAWSPKVQADDCTVQEDTISVRREDLDESEYTLGSPTCRTSEQSYEHNGGTVNCLEYLRRHMYAFPDLHNLDPECKVGIDGATLEVEDQYTVAFREAFKRLKLTEVEKDEFSRSRVWFDLGCLYQARARKTEKLRMTETIPSTGVPLREATAKTRFTDDTNMTRALACFSASAVLAGKLKDYKSCGTIYGCIGNALHCLGDFNEALVFHKWRLKVARRIGDIEGEFRALRNIGSEYASLQIFDQALEAYSAARSIAIRMGDLQREQRCLQHIHSLSKTISNEAVPSTQL